MASSMTDSSQVTSESLVDIDSHFDGLYRTRQNLRVEGVAEGEIQCEGTLTVEQGARVKAKITASKVTVAGDLEGEVVCEDVFKITPTGQVEAMVTARRLIVEEGGFYNGEFHMTKEEPDTYADTVPAADRSLDDWLARLPSVDTLSEEVADEDID